MSLTAILFNLIALQGCPPCCSAPVPCNLPSCGNCPPPPPGVSIDNFTLLLIIAGLAIGVWYFYKLKDSSLTT